MDLEGTEIDGRARTVRGGGAVGGVIGGGERIGCGGSWLGVDCLPAQQREEQGRGQYPHGPARERNSMMDAVVHIGVNKLGLNQLPRADAVKIRAEEIGREA